MSELENILICNQAKEISEKRNSGVLFMLANNQELYLKNIYSLFNRNKSVRAKSFKFLENEVKKNKTAAIKLKR